MYGEDYVLEAPTGYVFPNDLGVEALDECRRTVLSR